jgi:hypothetical protein
MVAPAAGLIPIENDLNRTLGRSHPPTWDRGSEATPRSKLVKKSEIDITLYMQHGGL